MLASKPGVAKSRETLAVHAVQAPAAAGVATAVTLAAQYGFTPAESLLGGLTLGVLASSKFAITGRILGISGIVRGLVKGNGQVWRVAFVAGLISGGFALQFILPSAFEVLPAVYTYQRAIAAGLLVGVGTAMGSGCTSGHGICGNSRLSLRSLVATLSFMGSGALATYLSGTTAVFGIPPGIAPLMGPVGASPAAKLGIGLLVLAILAMWVLGAAGRFLTSPRCAPTPAALQKELQGAEELENTSLTADPPAEPINSQKLASLGVLTELMVGFLFAIGLGVSGMVKPSKVAAFLSVLAGSFDPSLMLVMGGALLVSLPSFQAVLRFNKLQRPVCASCFDLPSKLQIDTPLVVGSILFGAGWGIGGVCPGPGLVNLASLQPQVLVLVLAMVCGMWLEAPITARLTGKGGI